VPPGRSGMQPDLRATYSSASSAATILGHGWDIGFPYVQRSTRKGQPTYGLADIFSIRCGEW
jgi:hypothetical protein